MGTVRDNQVQGMGAFGGVSGQERHVRQKSYWQVLRDHDPYSLYTGLPGDLTSMTRIVSTVWMRMVKHSYCRCLKIARHMPRCKRLPQEAIWTALVMPPGNENAEVNLHLIMDCFCNMFDNGCSGDHVSLPYLFCTVVSNYSQTRRYDQ